MTDEVFPKDALWSPHSDAIVLLTATGKGDEMRVYAAIALASATALLAACGTTPGDRGLSGAGIGAATGAVVGAAVGAPLAGAAIGAGAGAVTGVATSPSTVDLGKPVWNQ